MKFQSNDGGRSEAGFKGRTGDCVTRAIAIATSKPYAEVYAALNATRDGMRQTKRVRGSKARDGVTRPVYERYLKSLGWKWTPTMGIGAGCTIHLRDGELPAGTLVVRLSRHMCAVIDGVIHDNYDPSRNGLRCVYGYWSRA